MSMYRGLLAALTLMLVPGTPAPAQQASPLGLLPADAPLVVQVRGFERAKQRLGGLLGNAVPDLAPKVMNDFGEALRELLHERRVKAITPDGHIFVAFMDLTGVGESPAMAFAVPVTSYKEFVDGFLKEAERKTLKSEDKGLESVTVNGNDAPTFLVDLKSHVVISRDKETAQRFLKKEGGLKLSDETRRAFLTPDLAVYVNLTAFNDAFGAQLKAFKGFMDIALQQGGAAEGIDKRQMEIAKDFIGGLFQVVEDGVAAVISAEFRPEGLSFRLHGQFGSKTATGKFLDGLKPGPLADLGKLPAGQMFYSGMGLEPKLSKALSSLITEFYADDEAEDVKKAIEAATKELEDAGLQAQYSAASLPPAGIEVNLYKDPARGVSAQLKLLRALGEASSFQNFHLKKKPEVTENARAVGAFKLHHARLTFDMEKAVADLPEEAREGAKASFIRMLGGEEMNLWFGTDGKQVVQLTAKDWKTAEARLNDYVKGVATVGGDEGFTLTRKNLAGDNTLVALFDAGRTVIEMFEMFKEMAGAMPGLPAGQIPELRKPAGKPAYVGIAVALKPEYGTLEMFIPTTAAQQIRKVFSPLTEKDD